MKTANRLFFIAKLLTYILYKLQFIELFNVIILPQRHTHSINFCLISLCLIISNHHLPYLNFTLAFLLQHKPLIFIIFFGKYSLMRIGVCLAMDILSAVP